MLCYVFLISLYIYTYTDGGDQTEHDYIQMYMQPKPSGFTFNNLTILHQSLM